MQTNIETVRASFDTLVATYEELELVLTEDIWEAEHSAQRNQAEEEFANFLERMGGITISFEKACLAHEKGTSC